jgi:Abortive infection alpha
MSFENEGGLPEFDLSGSENGAPEPPPAARDRNRSADDLTSSLAELRVDTVLDALPALARLAAEAWLRSAAWGVGAGTKVGVRLVRAAVDPRSAALLVQDVGTGMRGYAREFLGISDLDERVKLLSPGEGRFVAGTGPAAVARARRARRDDRDEDLDPGSEEALRAQGAELLRQSADVRIDDRTHPAYVRILQELAPDEARILRLLAVEGPQPAVDVRTANLIGVGSQLVAHGLNMVGAESGCRHVDRVPAYLNNLERLGLVAFSDEPLDDPIRYQVLEAQPDVLDAIKQASRAKSIQRTLRLTPFGKDFCDVCLPLDTAEFEALTGDL